MALGTAPPRQTVRGFRVDDYGSDPAHRVPFPIVGCPLRSETGFPRRRPFLYVIDPRARLLLAAILPHNRFTSRAAGTIHSPCPRERKDWSGGERAAGRAGCATGCAPGPA